MGGPIRRNHNDVCRDRIEAELSKTDIWKDRLGRAKDRLDAKSVEMVEEMADGIGNPKDVSHEEQQTQGEMPAASANMGDEVLLEEGPNGSTETRLSVRGTGEIYTGTRDRPRKEKRRGDPHEMDEDINKTCSFNSEIEEGDNDNAMSVPGSRNDQPDTKLRKLDAEMLVIMTEIDRTNQAAAFLGVDIAEVYSPERVAKVAAEFGL